MTSSLRSASLFLLLYGCLSANGQSAGAGFVSLFNGRDLAGWEVPKGDNGHWKVIDGVIDYDALSEAQGDKNLWTKKSYGDFVLKLEWRITRAAGIAQVPEILPDGSYRKGPNGKDLMTPVENADSGVYLRGSSKAQVNIWCWPAGSGEIYGYRVDQSMPPAVRAAVTPKIKADRPIGEWNAFEITMKGSRVSVVLNGQTVIADAELPGVAADGPIALQHHGGIYNGAYHPSSSLVQFRNLWIKELSGRRSPPTK